MKGDVYQLHSTLELPYERLLEYLEAPDLPEEVAGVDLTRRNNTLILKAVPIEGTISKYTPPAQLKASLTDVRVYEEDPDDFQGAPPQWGEEEVEIESELVEYAAFKGDRETVLQNSALQYPMFKVLREIAKLSEKGTLTAITAEDGELEATRIVDGEVRAATVEVVEGAGSEKATANGVDWRDNKFIS